MALETYTDLLAAVTAWPDLQGEEDLEAIAPTLISLAEAAINQTPTLRLKEGLSTVVVGDEASDPVSSYELPADCLQVSYVTLAEKTLIPEAISTVLDKRQEVGCSGYGVTYAIDGLNLIFSEPVGVFTVRYHRKLDPLENVGSHWLFQMAPDLYLFGALSQVAIFSKEPEQEISRYASAYSACIGRLKDADWDSKAPLRQINRARR